MHQLDQYTEHLIRHQQAAIAVHIVRRQLIREALAGRRSPFYRFALVSIGRHLVIWGTQLQRRYDDLPGAPVLSRSDSQALLANK